MTFTEYVAAYEVAHQANPDNVWLSADIETAFSGREDDESERSTSTPDGAILRVSFSYEPFTAVSVPWTAPYLDNVRRLLLSPGIKVFWNQGFDVPILESNGFHVAGTVWDAMDAFHLYEPDLPKGLEWVSSFCTDLLPWKHLNIAEPALYSCIDADAALRNMIDLKKALESRGQFQAFLDHSVELMPILAKAGAKGNKINVEKQNDLRERLTQYRIGLEEEAQPLVPRSLKPRQLYKRQPEEVGGAFPLSFGPVEPTTLDRWDILYEPSREKVCSACGQFASNKSEHFKGPEGPPHPKSGKPTRLKNECKLAGGVITEQDAFTPMFYEVLDFNPNSSDQLKAYIRAMGHPMGKDKKDSSKETADAKHLEWLIKNHGEKHPIYAIVLEVHKLSKTIGTYLPEPDANGYIHTEYVNSPSTWRLGSRKVKFGTQIQNWGKRESNKWAKEARGTLIASPGCKLIQIDSASVEAVMLGWFMGDAEYIALASQSVHAWLACKQLGWDFNPDTVNKVKAEHGSLYDQMKVTNHMTNYGGTPYVLWQTFPKLFATKQQAELAQANVFRLIPKLKSYQHNVRWRAQKEGYLETPWHIRHPFYDVFTITDSGETKDGKDSKRVVAFEPQSSNGTFQRDNIRLIAKTKFGEYLCAIANVHDSMGLDCPTELVDEAVETLLEVFTRPIPQMGGLRIGAEVEVGDNWGSYHPEKNPGGMQSIRKVTMNDPGILVRAA